MPFKSKAQQRWAYANKEKLKSQGMDVEEWSDETDFSKLPERKKPKKTAAQILKEARQRAKVAASTPAKIVEFYLRRARQKQADQIPGGQADLPGAEGGYDPAEQAEGRKHEMEHTDDPSLAQEIADDHLEDNPQYYTDLGEMEDQATMRGDRELGDPDPADLQIIQQFLQTQENLDDDTVHNLMSTLGVDPHEGEEHIYAALQDALNGKKPDLLAAGEREVEDAEPPEPSEKQPTGKTAAEDDRTAGTVIGGLAGAGLGVSAGKVTDRTRLIMQALKDIKQTGVPLKEVQVLSKSPLKNLLGALRMGAKRRAGLLTIAPALTGLGAYGGYKLGSNDQTLEKLAYEMGLIGPTLAERAALRAFHKVAQAGVEHQLDQLFRHGANDGHQKTAAPLSRVVRFFRQARSGLPALTAPKAVAKEVPFSVVREPNLPSVYVPEKLTKLDKLRALFSGDKGLARLAKKPGIADYEQQALERMTGLQKQRAMTRQQRNARLAPRLSRKVRERHLADATADIDSRSKTLLRVIEGSPHKARFDENKRLLRQFRNRFWGGTALGTGLVGSYALTPPSEG